MFYMHSYARISFIFKAIFFNFKHGNFIINFYVIFIYAEFVFKNAQNMQKYAKRWT